MGVCGKLVELIKSGSVARISPVVCGTSSPCLFKKLRRFRRINSAILILISGYNSTVAAALPDLSSLLNTVKNRKSAHRPDNSVAVTLMIVITTYFCNNIYWKRHIFLICITMYDRSNQQKFSFQWKFPLLQLNSCHFFNNPHCCKENNRQEIVTIIHMFFRFFFSNSSSFVHRQTISHSIKNRTRKFP